MVVALLKVLLIDLKKQKTAKMESQPTKYSN